jgi:hypothetical protein
MMQPRAEISHASLVPSACAYGSEGWGFESLRARTFGRAVMCQDMRIALNLRFGFRAFLYSGSTHCYNCGRYRELANLTVEDNKFRMC